MAKYMQEHFSHDPEEEGPEEVDCKRCYGTGEDRDGADCVPCGGYGTVLIDA
jgi:hypothetical protein